MGLSTVKEKKTIDIVTTLKLIDGRLDIEKAESKDGKYICSSYHKELKAIISTMEPQTEEIDECEKCGGEATNKLVGDEVYRWCPDCGFGIRQ